jgi:glycerol-3-phosphate acyltransferase PlsY
MSWIQQIFGESVSLSQSVCILVGGYIFGCFATGYYLVRLRLGQDVREMGSGNAGAKNAGRVLGMHGFWITLLGDFGKGALAVGLTQYFTSNSRLAALAMLAVVIGHIWPIQLGLRGGKGFATSIGAISVYDFHLALAFVGLFAGIFLVLRRTTLTGLVAFACLPLAAKFMDHEFTSVVFISFLAAFVLLAHWRNLIEEIALLTARRSVEPKPDESFK